MGPNFIIREFKIEQLYVNPDNARFINAEELPDEVAAIEELTSMKKTHIDRIAKDIATYGLNPNELPIVIPAADNEGHFLVIDGNRRISSIKLMTQYKKELDSMKIESSKKKKLLNLQCNIKTITCVLYEKEEDVNYLIEKLHTSKPGIGQVMWDPQAQDRHNSKSGETSKRLALIEMLRYSKYTSLTVKNILDEEGWLSKLKRFISKKYISFFGIDFDKDNNILLYLEECEVIKGLSQLVYDLNETKANLIAQTKDTREAYLKNFPVEKKPNKEKVNETLVKFNFEAKQFIITGIKNDRIKRSNEENKDVSKESQNSSSSNGEVRKKEDPSSKNDLHNNDEKSEDKNKTGQDNKKTNEKDNDLHNDNKGKKSINSNVSDLKSTAERTTLIPKDEDIPIKNQRTLDLYKELKMVSVILYTNTVSIAFRSLIEFSVECFLDKRNSKWSHNTQITLFQKLAKVINILENEIGKSQLISEIPAIYRSVENYKAKDKKVDINSVTNLNVIIHNSNYHPTEMELKTMYNNYSPLLKRIWEKI
ncbi:hypothetical protein [Alkaliphilus hydrothermalis]|uniref:Organic radical activating enzyme n=1 Tax=Alkaliphilus hydrothermalis TaxID=1482730 RepID=A0ABS2NT79_9FIRM|nr:hypothetical protein [Alkaliphilus hydrothermalis]MBM7616163.1 organic radical activating enzyme [Alkaliphilus hydrothermalis]